MNMLHCSIYRDCQSDCLILDDFLSIHVVCRHVGSVTAVRMTVFFNVR